MSAGVYDFTCEQGAEFVRILTVQDNLGTLRDFSYYTATMHVRRRQDSTTTLIEFTTGDGSITLDNVGIVTLTKSGSETAAIVDSGVYDLFITPSGGEPEKLLMQ